MNAQKTISPRAWAELLLLALVWGAVFLSVRIALNEIGVLSTVAHRALWAALVLWALVFALRLHRPKGAKIWGVFLVMGLLNNIIPFTLLNWSQLHIESGLTAILNSATAICGVLVAALFLTDERLSTRKLAGVSIGFFGVATAVGLENLRNFDIRSLAQIAALTATLSYAFAGVWARKHLTGLPPLVAAAGMLTCTALIMVPLAWHFEGPLTLELRLETLAAIAYYALVATVLAYLLYYRVLAMAGSGNLMLVTLIMPPIAIVLGWAVLGEALHPRALLGFGILALGLLILDGRLWTFVRNKTL
ncbi:DMT family transporter [Lentibacter sp. XHP0401]|uniref:DMT family transporter n=1 Tax=Lentibacter sp. XHP0401 TaxID=2984334 RepID=UPI0021E974B7|nr:DMT family transporter [Lentibacter sp. XHP0401]MCV2892313.1 DMT family transporter [Lentibacter sp. XHP0401]